MKHLLFIFFLIPVLGIGQIHLSGYAVSSDNETLGFTSVVILKNDSFVTGTIADTSGYFSLTLKEKGRYNIILKNMSWKDSLSIFLENDTIIKAKLTSPLAFSQPCREILEVNNITLDLPQKKEDYERIKSESEKLGLKNFFNNDSIFIRLWVEHAFEYLGGRLYELSYDKKWTFTKYKYHSNYSYLLDSLSKIGKFNDAVFDSLLDFEIYSKKHIFLDKLGYYQVRFNKNNEFVNYLNEMLKVEDYCKMILLAESFTLDGVIYHLEVRVGNNYKFISFDNPDKTSKYKQILLFLKILAYIKRYE